MSNLLHMDRVTVRYERREPPRLRDCTLSLGPGESLTVVGESGAGKSTLLRTLAGFLPPSCGRVQVCGAAPYASRKSRRQARRQLGWVPQSPRAALDPTWTVLETVAEPLRILRHVPRAAALERAEELLSRVGLFGPALHRRPDALSGGQCQRVAVARAVLHEPRLVLADEPTASLDPETAASVLVALQRVTVKAGRSLVYVTHDLPEAFTLGGRLAVFLDGLLVEEITHFSGFDQLRHPYSRYLAHAVTRPVPPRPPAPATGCPFASLCPHVSPECQREPPTAFSIAPGHTLRCLLWSR